MRALGTNVTNRLLLKMLRAVPGDQWEDLSDICEEKHLNLEKQVTSDFERQNAFGKVQATHKL